jgi:hypothetical protein
MTVQYNETHLLKSLQQQQIQLKGHNFILFVAYLMTFLVT